MVGAGSGAKVRARDLLLGGADEPRPFGERMEPMKQETSEHSFDALWLEEWLAATCRVVRRSSGWELPSSGAHWPSHRRRPRQWGAVAQGKKVRRRMLQPGDKLVLP